AARAAKSFAGTAATGCVADVARAAGSRPPDAGSAHIAVFLRIDDAVATQRPCPVQRACPYQNQRNGQTDGRSTDYPDQAAGTQSGAIHHGTPPTMAIC